jgi:hypothetical protein
MASHDAHMTAIRSKQSPMTTELLGDIDYLYHLPLGTLGLHSHSGT